MVAAVVVTIDGPAGSGKSTAARLLAQRLGFVFLDTGAMYRCVAWKCRQMGVDLQDHPQVALVARELRIRFEDERVFVAAQDVSQAIRTPESSEGSSVVARNTEVRSNLVELQRRAAAGQMIVTEGRDQGTVAFPEAICKFFLTADCRTRAERRFRELQSRGLEADLDEIEQQLEVRDQRDLQRAIAPLKPADDAMTIDTSGLTIVQVVDQLEREARDRINRGSRSETE